LNEQQPSDNSATRLSLLLRMRDLRDAQSWREFVECYAPRVFDWCRKFGLQDADAADATQSVLLKLVDQLKQFEYDQRRGLFRSWLKTITRNVALDLQREWRKKRMGALAGMLADLPDDQPFPEDELFEAVEAAWREDVLRLAETRVRLRIQPGNWQAYWLCCRENLSAANVATQLGLTVSDVYVAKSRVLKQLRIEISRLSPQEDE
jgi:RNA polymerase sigma factor (sigma-70 family)